jgi:hypothetical protein
MFNRISRLIGCAGLVACVVGCGQGGVPKTYPVAGAVTFKGQPLPKAVVTFFPPNGRPTAGITNEQGEFTLPTGAEAGLHKVAIGEPAVEMKEGDYSVPPPAPLRYPANYTDPNRSGLQFEVKPAEANTFAIELKE